MESELYNNALIPGILIIVLDVLFFWKRSDSINAQIRSIQGSDFQLNPIGALIFYPFLLFGFYYFILKDKRPVTDAVIFGIFLFGAIESNNYALLKDWKLETLLVDTVWGGILLGLTAYLTCQLATKQINA
jgi:uncharacterized membrane protein